MFNFLRITKVSNFIDNFALAGIVLDLGFKRRGEKLEDIFIIALTILSIFLVILFLFVDLSEIILYFIIFPLIYLILSISYTNKFFPKTLSRFFKKQIKKKVKVSLKDKDFISFIKINYLEIRDMKLSKKETVKLLNNWKDHKEYFDNKREADTKIYYSEGIKKREDEIIKKKEELERFKIASKENNKRKGKRD